MSPDWETRYAQRPDTEPRPAAVLADNAHLLPAGGAALDLACGAGGNALLLARHGLDTRGWDSAATAIERLAARARAEDLPLAAEVRDVLAAPPAPGSFDVIAVSRFLERELAPVIVAALRPGGLLYYQTFTRSRLTGRGPRRERFRLAEGELPALFADLETLVYREERDAGDTTRGLRDEAQLVARRPAGRGGGWMAPARTGSM